MHNTIKTLLAVAIFAIAMAALESAVVVYLRELYYPGVFTVALKISSAHVLYIELAREMATLIMIACIGYLTGRNARQRVAYFLICFAIWDISYYIWLKVFIDWPLSLFDWDILFLIPITWLGPVLAPLICSATMIGLGIALLRMRPDRTVPRLSVYLMIAGSLIILACFMMDYGTMLLSQGLWKEYTNLMNSPLFLKLAGSLQPASFSWILFSIGEAAYVLSILTLYWQPKSIHMRRQEIAVAQR